METQRVILAIVLSMAILLGYQYFFAPPPPPPQEVATEQSAAEPAKVTGQSADDAVDAAQIMAGQPAPAAVPQGRNIAVTTSLYNAVFSEAGGVLKSFQLNDFKETLEADSAAKELVLTDTNEGLPLFFSWGVEPSKAGMATYVADKESVRTTGGNGALSMKAKLHSGVEIVKHFSFDDAKYLITMTVDVHNASGQALKGAPYLTMANKPFSASTNNNTWVFTGPALLQDGILEEVKVDDIKDEGHKTFTGNIGWVAYEDSYFMGGVVPQPGKPSTAFFSVAGENTVNTVVAGTADTIAAGASQQYTYQVYYGPKKLATLKETGHNLEKIVNFGWFDIMAKPTLYLLNFFHKYIGNYGVAIILVTVLIKLIFWPITQKGMKSMKTLQKLQPKMAKLREKYKDDKARQQQEMIKLYQTYKVNPLGGCLPMVIQIPVFFALYKVLLQTIELRHAPFMLWITDLSAPDRLFIGFDIPMLGGLPVLTILMGASMFLQQKMTPSTGDPTQQKIMMFLPLVFTFMFLNFASGLVLYWFINNLLSIGQQYFINRQVDSTRLA